MENKSKYYLIYFGSVEAKDDWGFNVEFKVPRDAINDHGVVLELTEKTVHNLYGVNVLHWAQTIVDKFGPAGGK